eukprot:scaffold308136_cov36-Tisochrysis_lutea.AAC.2
MKRTVALTHICFTCHQSWAEETLHSRLDATRWTLLASPKVGAERSHAQVAMWPAALLGSSPAASAIWGRTRAILNAIPSRTAVEAHDRTINAMRALFRGLHAIAKD